MITVLMPGGPATSVTCQDIPTCAGCQLTVQQTLSSAARGTMTSMPQSYLSASLVLNPGQAGAMEYGLSQVPILQHAFTTTSFTANSMPSNSQIRLFYTSGTFHLCHKVPVSVIH
jgi:hypothetical protein